MTTRPKLLLVGSAVPLALVATLATVPFEPAEPPAPLPEPREAGAPVRLPKGDSNRAERRAEEKRARKAAKRKGRA